MGVIFGVNPGNEAKADGYLKGQLWNRPRSIASRQICFKIAHLFTGTIGFASSYACAFYTQLFFPGYYVDQATFPPEFGWEAVSGADIYCPGFSEAELEIGTDQFVAPAASYMECRGFEDFPIDYVGGVGSRLANLDWRASDSAILGNYTLSNGCEGGDRITNVFLSIEGLERASTPYVVVEFLARVGSNNNGYPLLITDFARISAGISAAVFPAAPTSEDLYESFLLEDLSANTDTRFGTVGFLFSRQNPNGDLEYCHVYAFCYDTVTPSASQWLQVNGYEGYVV